MRAAYKKYLFSLVDKANKERTFTTNDFQTFTLCYNFNVREEIIVNYSVLLSDTTCYILKTCRREYYNGDYYEHPLELYKQLYIIDTTTKKIYSRNRIRYFRNTSYRAKMLSEKQEKIISILFEK